MDTLTGSVERITFYNPENGYSVLRLRPDGRKTPGQDRAGLVTVTGNLPELTPGEYLKLSGRWNTHPKHGLQFQVEYCEQTLPATVAGIRRYLGSGLVKGIGPRLADRIVSHFGNGTLEVIEKQPELLRQVPDIGPKRARLIAAAWEEQRQVKEIMLFLHSYAVSTGLAVKIYKQYGENALQIVQSDPYRLARDIYGIGFKTADRIAQALGLPEDHPSRLEAGLIYALNQATDEGHVYLPDQELIESTGKLLQVPSDLVVPALVRLAEQDCIRKDTLPFGVEQQASSSPPQPGASEPAGDYGFDATYLTPLFHNETGVAGRLRALASAWPTRLSDLPPAFVTLDPELSSEQQTAIRTALSHPVSILTGGPGTGKTTALKALIAALESAGKSYALASPTGRAAKRMSQATGRPASTIHRLLGFSPGEGFKINTENPLSADLVVVDEASMLDLSLAHHLLKALPRGTHLLLVGDVDQLPSVGAGDVLRDLITSNLVPVTRLSVIFRQAAHSQIITNAHRIHHGQMPVFVSSGGSKSREWPGDFFLFPAGTPEDAANWVLEVVCHRIPQKFGLQPRDAIQVLAPMYRGVVGVNALNDQLQASLNPPEATKAEKKLFGQTLRVGDKLMQTQNNYDKEVFNGDIGRLYAINSMDHTLTIDFEGRGVIYDWNEADQLTLAYAISVHKSQGSEFPAVVIPLVTQHYLMLQRNLLYTAVTRARQLCVLVGDRRAIGIAVGNDRVSRRYTALGWRLSY
jgi:exodeoxyribonuclease V alpha subunit